MAGFPCGGVVIGEASFVQGGGWDKNKIRSAAYLCFALPGGLNALIT